ncbi:MAG: hypothetical protein ACHQNT_13355 [Bacteroidia bacterium]
MNKTNFILLLSTFYVLLIVNCLLLNVAGIDMFLIMLGSAAISIVLFYFAGINRKREKNS